MPNWVSNTVIFKSEDVEKVKALVTTADRAFDFERIIPMPESLKIVSGSTTHDALTYLSGVDLDKLKRYPDEGEEPSPSVFYGYERHPETLPELRVFAMLIAYNKAKYGMTDWYDWANAKWGTKWNAHESMWDGYTVVFDTAWSDPEPIFIELSKLLGITFTVRCQEESLAFCSITEYSNGEKTWEDSAEGIEGLILLGFSKEEVIEWYGDDCVEEYPELKEEIDAAFD